MIESEEAKPVASNFRAPTPPRMGAFQKNTGIPLDRRRLKEAGISSRHLDVLLGRLPILETTSLRLARAFRAEAGHWCLLLSGPHGVGKTLAAEWVVVEAIRADEIAIDGARRLLTPIDIRDACFDPAKRTKMQNMRLLVLDDLGCESGGHGSPFNWLLSELLDFRWRHEKATVITTNLPGRDLLRRYGKRVIDRLRHNGRCVTVAGANLRNASLPADEM